MKTRLVFGLNCNAVVVATLRKVEKVTENQLAIFPKSHSLLEESVEIHNRPRLEGPEIIKKTFSSHFNVFFD